LAVRKWIAGSSGWQKVHHQEVPLSPGAQLKFGATQNAMLEFVVVEVE
jgi:hypothetical protein